MSYGKQIHVADTDTDKVLYKGNKDGFDLNNYALVDVKAGDTIILYIRRSDYAGDKYIISPGEQITISYYPKSFPIPLLYVNMKVEDGMMPMLTNSDIDVTEGIELIEVINYEVAYLKVRIDGTITARPYDGD